MEEMTLERKILSTNDWGLIAMLHEGLIERFKEAILMIEEDSNENLNEVMNNCRDIISELLVTFREKDELSTNLRELYLFTNKLMTEGEIKREQSKFIDAIKVIEPIQLGFKGLEAKEDANIVTGLTYGKEELYEHINKSSKTFEG